MDLEKARNIVEATEWQGDLRQNLTTLANAAKTVLSRVDECNRFSSLVAEMRHAQKEYFRTKSNMDECKRLERKVDAALERMERPTLFD